MDKLFIKTIIEGLGLEEVPETGKEVAPSKNKVY